MIFVCNRNRMEVQYKQKTRLSHKIRLQCPEVLGSKFKYRNIINCKGSYDLLKIGNAVSQIH